ncbi:SHOCT domain-containing protein [[Eubacterium] cellulosolvens]
MNGMGLMGFGWLWTIVLVIIILMVIYYFTAGFKQESSKPTSMNSLEILKQRYAKGEINEEEFRKMKKEIE